MARRYRVFRTLMNGEEMLVASRNDMADATHLLESLKRYWPGDYSVRDKDDEGETDASAESGVTCVVCMLSHDKTS
jgi:hypothetical protein